MKRLVSETLRFKHVDAILPVIDAGWRRGRCFRVAPHLHARTICARPSVHASIVYFLANRDMTVTESEPERQMHRVEPRRRINKLWYFPEWPPLSVSYLHHAGSSREFGHWLQKSASANIAEDLSCLATWWQTNAEAFTPWIA